MNPDELIRERMATVLNEGDVAVDVGSNPQPKADVYYVEHLSDCVGESGVVIAFDPFPFGEMLEIADERDNVVFVEQAVAAEPLAIVESQEVAGNWITNLQRTYTGHVPLDAVAHANVVKVDVEGFELDVIESASRLIWKVKPVWFIELHPHKPKAPDAVQSVLDHLMSAGYDVWTADGDDEVAWAEDLDEDGAAQVVALP